MTLPHARRTLERETRGEDTLLPLLRKGQDDVHRLSLLTCLLERRLRGGAEPADLQVLVQDVKFAVEELQALFQSVMQTATSAPSDT